MRVFEKKINVDQPWTGNDTFVTDMAKTTEQIAEEFDFKFIPWSEIAMSAFAGKNMLMFTVPDQTGFAQTRSRRDHSLVSRRRMLAFVGGNLVESDRIGWTKTLNSPSLCLEIIDQIDAIKMKFLRQMRRLDDPRKIGSLNASIAHRTGNPEAGDCRANAGFGNEFEDN